MFNYLKTTIKLYLTMIIVTSTVAIYFSSLNNTIWSLSIMFCCIFIFAMIKDIFYLKRALHIKEKCNNKIQRETKNLSEIEFLAYIQEKKDIEIQDERYELPILIQQIVYKGNYNEKTVAKKIFKKRFN